MDEHLVIQYLGRAFRKRRYRNLNTPRSMPERSLQQSPLQALAEGRRRLQPHP